MGVKSPADLAQEFAQSAVSNVPVIILGSGASAAHSVPGMGPLAEHLKLIAAPSDWNVGESREWLQLLALLEAGKDLETALQTIRPSERQTRLIATETRRFLLPSDQLVLGQLLLDRQTLPLSRLFKSLFDSVHQDVHVVTPNYDRLAEYAADAADLNTFTGFSLGHLQVRARSSDTRVHVGNRRSRTVCVWKVHGSLDWFQTPTRESIGLRSGIEPPANYDPLMVTPGLDKYRLTHTEPFRTIIGCADAALEAARAYLCIGYGFNDQHLQEKLIERCARDSVPLVIIAKELSDAARTLLSGGRCRKYAAFEECGEGATAYTHDVQAGFFIEHPVWRLDAFLDFTLGSKA